MEVCYYIHLKNDTLYLWKTYGLTCFITEFIISQKYGNIIRFNRPQIYSIFNLSDINASSHSDTGAQRLGVLTGNFWHEQGYKINKGHNDWQEVLNPFKADKHQICAVILMIMQIR